MKSRSRAKAVVSVAALQLIKLRSQAAKDVQDLLHCYPNLRDLDMAGMEMDAGEWTHIMNTLESHPTVERIDMTGVKFPSAASVQQLLLMVERNGRITEVLVEDTALAEQLKPLVDHNRATQESLRLKAHSQRLERQLQQRDRQLFEERVLLGRIEAKERSSLVSAREAWYKEHLELSVKRKAQIVHQTEQAASEAHFLFEVSSLVSLSCHERYSAYMFHFLKLLLSLRQEQETVGRAWLASIEVQYRNAIRRKYYNDYEDKDKLEKARLKHESERRAALVAIHSADRNRFLERENQQWKTLLDANEAFHRRTAELEEAITNRLKEGEKRRQQRKTELETRRQYRLEKVTKDQNKLNTAFYIEKEKMARNETFMRIKTMQEEPQMRQTISDLFAGLTPQAQAESKAGEILKQRDQVLSEAMVLQIFLNGTQDEPGSVTLEESGTRSPSVLTPRLGFHQQEEDIVPYYFAMVGNNHLLFPFAKLVLSSADRQHGGKPWKKRAQEKIGAANQSLAQIAKLRPLYRAKLQAFMSEVRALQSKFSMSFGFTEILTPLEASALPSERLYNKRPTADLDFDDLDTRRRTILAASVEFFAMTPIVPPGAVTPTTLQSTDETPEEYEKRLQAEWNDRRTCTFEFDGLPPLCPVESVQTQPNRAKVNLCSDGTVGIEDLETVVQCAQLNITLLPGSTLPFIQEISMVVTLQFATLRDAVTSVITSAARYMLEQRVTTKVLVSTPFASVPKTATQWAEPTMDAPALGQLSMKPATLYSPSEFTVRKVDKYDLVGGVHVDVSLTEGATPFDMLLISSYCDFKVQPVYPPKGTTPKAAELSLTRTLSSPDLKHTSSTGVLPFTRRDIRMPTTFKIIFEGMEIGEVEPSSYNPSDHPLKTLQQLRSTHGTNFVHVCQLMKFHLCGKAATVHTVQRFLSHITFFNRASAPTPGRRTILVSVTINGSTCHCPVALKVTKHNYPTTLSLQEREFLFHALTNGNVIQQHVAFIEPAEYPLFKKAVLEDDERHYFSGGYLRVSIESGFKIGDGLRIIPGGDKAGAGEILLERRVVTDEEAASASSPALKSKDELIRCAADVIPIGEVVAEFNVYCNGVFIGVASFYPPQYLVEAITAVLPAKVDNNVAPSPLKKPPPKKGGRVPRKERKTADTALVFADLESLTRNGPASVEVEFTKNCTGVSIDAVTGLLQRIFFSSFCLAPKLGERKISVELLVGKPIVANDFLPSSADNFVHDNKSSQVEHSELINETLVARVGCPIMRTMPQNCMMKYLVGGGWKSIPAIDFIDMNEGVPLNTDFAGGSLVVTIVDGFTPETDFLWVLHESFFIDGLARDALMIEVEDSVEGAQESRRFSLDYENSAIRQGLRIYSAGKMTYKVSQEVIATVTFKEGKLSIQFTSSPISVSLTINVIQQIAKGVSFLCSRANLDSPVRGIQVAVTTGKGQVSHSLFKLSMQTEDEPPEVVFGDSKVVVRHGLVPQQTSPDAQVLSGLVIEETADGIPFTMFPVAPICEAMISDSDSEYFDGGFLFVSFSGTASKGDTLGMMSLEQQRAQYASINLAPKILVSVDSDNRIVAENTSEVFGTVSYPPSQEFVGATNLRVDFAKSEHRKATRSLVSIDVVSYILNCVCYWSVVPDRLRAGPRTIRVAVSDGGNPAVGSATTTIDVLSPLLFSPEWKADGAVMAAGAPTIVGAKIQSFVGKDEQIVSGFLDFWLMNGNELDLLTFNPSSFASMFFDLKTNVGDGTTLVYDNNSVLVAKLVSRKHSITFQTLPQGRMLGKHFDTLLRCVLFETKDIDAVANKTMKLVKVSASDGMKPGLCNSVIVSLKVTPKK